MSRHKITVWLCITSWPLLARQLRASRPHLQPLPPFRYGSDESISPLGQFIPSAAGGMRYFILLFLGLVTVIMLTGYTIGAKDWTELEFANTTGVLSVG